MPRHVPTAFAQIPLKREFNVRRGYLEKHCFFGKRVNLLGRRKTTGGLPSIEFTHAKYSLLRKSSGHLKRRIGTQNPVAVATQRLGRRVGRSGMRAHIIDHVSLMIMAGSQNKIGISADQRHVKSKVPGPTITAV